MTANPATEPEPRSVAPTQFRDPDRYEIIAEHGRGGLGRVFRAHDRELERDVAIKELLARDYRSEARFMREALITARLEHPGIVPIHEAGRWPFGGAFGLIHFRQRYGSTRRRVSRRDRDPPGPNV